jgi:magnesium chelatase subunit H
LPGDRRSRPALYELERTLIPEGLHVLGQAPQGTHRSELIDAMLDADPDAERAAIEAALDASDEIGAVIHALDGGYIKPAPGGDILANRQVLPTGRNIHGFDPFAMPSRFACIQGQEQAERLIARHLESGEPFPKAWPWCCGAPTT